MKNFFQKLLSILLIVLISFSITTEAFAQNNFSHASSFLEKLDVNNFSEVEIQKGYSSEEEMKEDYRIVSEMDTPYGKMYFMKKKGLIETRAVGFWDAVDIGMAVSSWAELFNEPNVSNTAWAILDTAALLPIIPSLRYVKNPQEAGKVIAEFGKKSKENMDKILRAFKVGGETLRKALRSIYMVKYVRFPQITVKQSQLISKFKHARDLRLTNKAYHEFKGAAQHQIRDRILNQFRHEIIRVLQNSRHVFMHRVGGTPAYAFVYDGKVAYIDMYSFQFLSIFPLTEGKRRELFTNAIQIKELGARFVQFLRY